MRFSLNHLIIFVTAFLIGTIGVYSVSFPGVSNQVLNDTTYIPISTPYFQKSPSCLKNINVKLGDNFDYVENLFNLSKDYNGANENTEWRKGRLTDFFAMSHPLIDKKLDSDNRLNSSIFAVFDDNKRLASLSITWLLDGDKTLGNRNKAMKVLVDSQLNCFSLEEFDSNNSKQSKTQFYKEYNQTFGFDFTEDSSYGSFRYSIESK